MSIENIKFNPIAKTAEEYVLNELHEKKLEICELENELAKANECIDTLRGRILDIMTVLDPKLQGKDADGAHAIILPYRIWEDLDSEKFKKALKAFGLEDIYATHLEKEAAENESV